MRRDRVYRLGAATADGGQAATWGETSADVASALGLGDVQAIMLDEDGKFDAERAIKGALAAVFGALKRKKDMGNRKDSTQKTFYVIYEALMWSAEQLALCTGPLAPAVRSEWIQRMVSLVRGIMTTVRSGALAIYTDSGQAYFIGLVDRAVGNALAVLKRLNELEAKGGPPCTPTTQVSITNAMRGAWDVRDNWPEGKLIQWVINNNWDPADGPPRNDSGSRRDWAKYFVDGVPAKGDWSSLTTGAAQAAAGGYTAPQAQTAGGLAIPAAGLPGQPWWPASGADDELLVSGKEGGASSVAQAIGIAALAALGLFMWFGRKG